MSVYSRILVAVDLTEDSAVVVRRGLEIAKQFQGRVDLLHVVEFIPVDPAGEALLPSSVDLEGELINGARQRLEKLCTQLGLSDTPRRVEVGSIKHEIVRVAGEMKADLIVLGSRGRHGLALLMGSTEKSILHKAPCDILAVRLN
jgi:universal stress protein A